MKFSLNNPRDFFSSDIRFDEILMQAASTQPQACIWQTDQCLVVPRTYQRFENFNQVCQDFASQGYPIYVRHSGGGVVPQGAGIINISLSYAVSGLPLDNSDQAYLTICTIIDKAISKYGIKTKPAPVQGSFCDGRFNVAYIDENGTARKIAGTAQIWRKNVVLVHALLLANCDLGKITQLANQLEYNLGNDKRYLTEAAISLHSINNAKSIPMNNFDEAIIKELQNAIQNHKLEI